MLTEEQLELMQERISNRFVKVNDELLEVIGTRVAEIGKVKNSDVYKLKRLLENGTDVKDIELRLAQATQKTIEDMEYMLERVAKENYEFAEVFYKAKGLEFVAFKDNAAINKKWQALYKQSCKELVNLTKNTAFMSMVDGKKVPTLFQTLYNDIIDKAVIEASSGLIDYQSAMRKTIRDVADSGLRSVDYATGYSRRLDTAVRQNVLWALKECNQQVSDMTGSEFGADGFEVSYHSNPRPSHVSMGGRMFSTKGDKRISGKFYPDGTIAKELLSDHGCLHFAFSVLLGISEPTISQDELSSLKAEDAKKIEFEGIKMTKYEASQKQRQIETKVRHLKDRANIAKASGDDELRRETQSKINLLTSKYAKLSKSANLPTKMERLGVRGFRVVKETKELKSVDVIANLLYNKGNSEENVKAYLKNRQIKAKIKDTPKTIEQGKQDKHIVGTNNYIKGKSYFTIPNSKIQDVINKYSGSGEIISSAKEVITADRIIGISVNPIKGHESLTDKATIHYSKKGTHLVPRVNVLRERSIPELKAISKKMAMEVYDTKEYTQWNKGGLKLSVEEKEKRIDLLMKNKVNSSKNNLIKDIKSMEKKILRERGVIK